MARSRDGKDLYCLLVYHGLYARDDVTKATEQFERLLARGDEFCVGDNWITHVSLTETSNTLSSDKAKDKPLLHALGQYAIHNIEVRNGALYREKETGRLGGYQVLCIRGIDELASRSNLAIGEGFAAEKETSPTFPMSYKLWKGLASRDMLRLIECKNSTINLSFPVAPQETGLIRAEMAAQAVQKLRDERSTESLLLLNQTIADNPISFNQTPDRFSFTLGYPGEPVNRLNFLRENRYSDNLTAFAAKQSVWRGERSSREIIEHFKRDPSDFYRLHSEIRAKPSAAAKSKPGPLNPGNSK